MRTQLTEKQEERLNRISDMDEGARVIAWSPMHDGPVLVRSNGDWNVVQWDGRRIKLSDGTVSGD